MVGYAYHPECIRVEDTVYLEVTATAVRPALVVCTDQHAPGGKVNFGDVGVG